MPEPPKKSIIRSPSLVEALIIRASNSSGFCVGYLPEITSEVFPFDTFAEISHQSLGIPLFMLKPFVSSDVSIIVDSLPAK